MKIQWLSEWFARRVVVADGVIEAHSYTAIPDAQILLCCATSALAARMWPGDKRDRKRFTEFLIEFAPGWAKVKRISIPSLVAKLEDGGRTSEVQVLTKSFYPQAKLELVDGNRIDQEENAVLKVVPDLPTREIRALSYAGIIYSDLRSGLIHEYRYAPFMSSLEAVSQPVERDQ